MFTVSTPLFPQFHSPLFNPPISNLYHNVHLSRSMSNSSNSHTKSSSLAYQASRWKHAPTPQRQVLHQSTRQSRESRNASVLQGIQERRQNARDQTRSEQILRFDMLAEQRAWEQAQEAEAARWSTHDEDEMHVRSDPELEEYLRRDEEELQARADEAMQAKATNHISGESGSENDDDFDMLILEALEEFERSQQNGQRDMDLS